MMDKNEAVQKLSKVARISVAYAEDLYDSFFPKPVVPQYVADWYEKHKENIDYELWKYLVNWDNQSPDRFKEWLNTYYEANQTLINMHQFGYEVEEEKRYRVDFKGFASNFRVLKHHLQFKNWFTGNDSKYDHTRMYHTRKELESNGFGWVFDCEGVEVKEVTDE